MHDLDRFAAFSLSEQEAVIGRTKVDSIELDSKHKPPTAHIARVESDEIPMYRRNVPYGSTTECWRACSARPEMDFMIG